MKRFMRFLITFLISLLFLCQNITVFALNTGFFLQPLSDEEKNAFEPNIDISLLEKEPTKRAIKCFDVNENNLIAIGSSVSEKKTIAIYNSEGVFQYGYEFDSSGRFGVEWDNDNIIIYFVRSDVACSVSPTGTIESFSKIENTFENNSYWNDFVFSENRTVGESEYTIKNDMGLFNIFASSYSQLEIKDSNGEPNIIYDVNSDQLLKTILGFIGVVIFSGTVIGILARYLCKQQKSKNNIEIN